MTNISTKKIPGAILALAAAAAMAMAPAAHGAAKKISRIDIPFVGNGKTTNLAKADAKAKAARVLSQSECRGVRLHYQVTRIATNWVQARLTFNCNEADLWQ